MKFQHLTPAYWKKVFQAIQALYKLVGQPKTKGKKMDILATLAAISTAIQALQAQIRPQPTSNFATADVVSAIQAQATALGVTPVQLPTATS